MKEILIYTIGTGGKGWYDIKLVNENDEFVDAKKIHYGVRKGDKADAKTIAILAAEELAKQYGGIKITWI